MDNQKLINEYQDSIVGIYNQYNLTSLSGLNLEFSINGKQIVVWHSNATRKASIKFNNQFDYYRNFDDLLFCSDELLYFTANLLLYRPYINNPINDGVFFGGEMIYPNRQNLEAKRYNMFADVVSQKAYNYWDRIGDLIASFFPGQIASNRIYFSTAIDSIPKDFQVGENYLWLKEFKETQYSELNKRRKQIVHYSTSNTDYKHKHLKEVHNKSAMQDLQTEHTNLADFYREHISYTLTGFEKTLAFIDDINPVLFKDIQ